MSLWPYSDRTVEGAREYWKRKGGKPAFHKLTGDEQRLVIQGYEKEERENRTQNGHPKP